MKRLFKLLLITALALVMLLPVLTACGTVEFKVDFIVDGEVYNTVSTNGQEVIKLPDNPTKEGYEFKGWYWDDAAWQKPFTANSLLDAPLTGNMSVYAKFDKLSEAIVETAPVPGTAYKLFIDQTNAGVRCFLDGMLSGYHFSANADIEKSVNVYVEEASLPGSLHMFCVKDGKRMYLNIVMGDNGQYCTTYNNSAITAYTFDLQKKTMVATLDGQQYILGESKSNNYKRIGARPAFESSFVSHFVLSTNPDEVIPEVKAEESDIAGIINGALGKYKTAGTVVAVNDYSYLISDTSGKILVFCNNGWVKDVEVGDTVEVSGDVVMYGNSKQFGVDSEYTVTGKTEVSYPTPEVLTAAELDAYMSTALITPRYVKITGVLSVSGSYYNVAIDGAAIIGSIVCPTMNIAALNGKTIEVTGFVTSTTGGARYLNIIATDVKEATGGNTPSNPGTDTPSNPGGSVTPTKSTVSEIVAGTVGEFYEVDGVVVGVNAQSFLLADSTGTILVYIGNTWTPDVAVGDKVTVSAGTSTFGNAVQLKLSLTYAKTGTVSVTYPTPKTPTAAELDAYSTATAIAPEYIKFTGVLTIDGNYYNVAIEGASIIGSITYPIADLSALNGKTVEIVGYVTGVSGSGAFLNVMTTSVTEVGAAPEEPEEPEEPTATKGTVANVIAATVGDLYEVSGTVVAYSTQAFVITDATGSIQVYRGNSWTRDLTVGDTVTVVGAVAEHGGAKQFGASATYTKTGNVTFTQPTAKELTVAEIDAYATKTSITLEYVRIGGILKVSGNFYNVEIDGATVMGSISNPTIDISRFADQYVEVEGYATSFSGGKYLNIIATNLYTEGNDPEVPDDTKTTVAKVIAGEVGGAYEVEGVVVGVNAQSFLLADETGAILVYLGKNWTPDVAVGDKLAVSGNTSLYGGAVQFGTTATYEKKGTATVEYPTPAVLSAAELDAYSSASKVTPVYVKITGVLTIDGYYYNVAIDGANIIGSLTYMTSDLSALNGKTIEIIGYVTGVTGSGGKYLNIMVISVNEA